MPLDNETQVKAPAAPTLTDIEQAASMLAGKRRALEEAARAADAEMAIVRKRHGEKLRRLVAAAAVAESDVLTLVKATPHLFERPRSHTFDGVKVGYAKGKGKISFDDEAKVIARIRKVFDEADAEAVINTTESLDKQALAKWDGKALKAVGVSVTDAGDAAFVRLVDTSVDKLVKALLEEAAE